MDFDPIDMVRLLANSVDCLRKLKQNTETEEEEDLLLDEIAFLLTIYNSVFIFSLAVHTAAYVEPKIAKSVNKLTKCIWREFEEDDEFMEQFSKDSVDIVDDFMKTTLKTLKKEFK